jgi:hypothetical protein
MQKMIWTLVSPRVPKVRHLTMHLPQWLLYLWDCSDDQHH